MSASPESTPSPAATDTATSGVPADETTHAPLSAIERDLQATQVKLAEVQDQYLRARAEAENARRRGQEELEKARKYAIESFAEDLVPVVDSLEKALGSAEGASDALREGIALTLRQLRTALERSRMVEIDPVGQRFDPHRHQAISMVPASEAVPAHHVVAVLQKGWLIGERVLRPALVSVAQPASSASPGAGGDGPAA